MPPKKASTAASKKTTSGHASYRGIRQSIKKYVQANNKIATASSNAFDVQFNKAIKVGVEKGEFTQPKGPSGPVKLAKKEAAPKPAAKKTAPATKAAPKKTAAAAKKTEKTEKPKAATKKATTTKKAAGRPKANTAKPRKKSTAVGDASPSSYDPVLTDQAPAVVDKPKVTSTTKSGRVTKTTAKPAEKATKRAAKKA
ncbi:hypothetical protein ATERTT37_000308 [Aspergillus terreus]